MEQSPDYSSVSWHEMIHITEGLLESVGHSVTRAVDCIREARHPGRVVLERSEIATKTYGVNVLPTHLTNLLLDRAANGVPSFFMTPPIRTERNDRMHDSANLKADEVRRTIYLEVISGKTLITSSSYRERELRSLPCSPLARVPKYDAAGIERSTGRVIRNHSYPQGLSINDFASLPTSIDITLPRIQEIIKDVLYYQQTYPEASILLTKRDISGAFEWNGFSSGVVKYFGSFVGDPDQAGFGDSMAFPMRSTFGYLHSPAEWHIISAAIDTITSATHLPVPRRDGVGEIAIRSYVDDAMIVCPDVGWRPWIVVQEIERVITGLLGPGALNDKKRVEEGKWVSDVSPLFSLQGHGMITRGFVSEEPKSAAKDLGYPTTGLSSHSLRGGGATALWNAGRTVEEICYLGRWKSDSWKIYTHMTSQRLAGIAADIASATYTLAIDKEDAHNIRNAGLASITLGPPMGSRWWDGEEGIEFVILNTYLSNTRPPSGTRDPIHL